MFMRFVRLSVKPDQIDEFADFYEDIVAPALHSVDGCLFATLIRDERSARDCISLTLWTSAEHAHEYEQSGQYAELLEKNRPYLIESSEWRVQLTDDLTLEYGPVVNQPEVDTFEVISSTAEEVPSEEELSHMYLRITSANVQQGKVALFDELYRGSIIPALKSVDGFKHAFLVASTESPNELLSVTIWESKDKADAYERSGRFAYLVDQVKPMLSSLFQWKVALDPSKKDNVVTSDDLKVEGFRVLTGD